MHLALSSYRLILTPISNEPTHPPVWSVSLISSIAGILPPPHNKMYAEQFHENLTQAIVIERREPQLQKCLQYIRLH